MLETAAQDGPERADYLPLFVAPQPVQVDYDSDDDDDDDDDDDSGPDSDDDEQADRPSGTAPPSWTPRTRSRPRRAER